MTNLQFLLLLRFFILLLMIINRLVEFPPKKVSNTHTAATMTLLPHVTAAGGTHG